MKTLLKILSVVLLLTLLGSVAANTAFAGCGNGGECKRNNGTASGHWADPDDKPNGRTDRSNGGPDKPPTTGGDWNNGSGNDLDCEDDNRGVGIPAHCLKDDDGDDGDDGGGDDDGTIPEEPDCQLEYWNLVGVLEIYAEDADPFEGDDYRADFPKKVDPAKLPVDCEDIVKVYWWHVDATWIFIDEFQGNDGLIDLSPWHSDYFTAVNLARKLVRLRDMEMN